jgi:hypothetical protein
VLGECVARACGADCRLFASRRRQAGAEHVARSAGIGECGRVGVGEQEESSVTGGEEGGGCCDTVAMCMWVGVGGNGRLGVCPWPTTSTRLRPSDTLQKSVQKPHFRHGVGNVGRVKDVGGLCGAMWMGEREMGVICSRVGSTSMREVWRVGGGRGCVAGGEEHGRGWRVGLGEAREYVGAHTSIVIAPGLM